MTPDIRFFNKLQDPQVEEYARERLDMLVGRFNERLSSIDIRVLDENAAKGGIDKCCSIDARLIPRGTLHVHAKERDIYEAVLKAVHRLETVVAKSVDRGHQGMSVRHQGGGLRRESNRVSEQEAMALADSCPGESKSMQIVPNS